MLVGHQQLNIMVSSSFSPTCSSTSLHLVGKQGKYKKNIILNL